MRMNVSKSELSALSAVDEPAPAAPGAPAAGMRERLVDEGVERMASGSICYSCCRLGSESDIQVIKVDYRARYILHGFRRALGLQNIRVFEPVCPGGLFISLRLAREILAKLEFGRPKTDITEILCQEIRMSSHQFQCLVPVSKDRDDHSCLARHQADTNLAKLCRAECQLGHALRSGHQGVCNLACEMTWKVR